MFELSWPWAFVLLPLPLLAWRLLPEARAQGAALMVPFYQQLASGASAEPGRRWPKLLLLCLCWLALLCAAARPMWIGEPVQLPTSGRDLLLAVDISGSMKQVDMQIKGERFTRLQAVKAVVGEFVERRQNDRLGLVLFGSQAYLQAPLTFDRPTVKQLLDEAQTGFAGEKTAIGDAIGLAIKRLRLRPAESRVLILLTDGANTAGEVSPLQAAQLAAQTQVKIYTVGVGADEMQVAGMFGLINRTVNPSADLDEKTLQSIAEQTGGQYFRARNPEQLAAIYRQLDTLEPIEQEQETFRPRKSLFHWPLGLALGLCLLALALKLLGSLWAGSSLTAQQREARADVKS